MHHSPGSRGTREHLSVPRVTLHNITGALLQPLGPLGLEEPRLRSTRHGATANPTQTWILQQHGRALSLTLAMHPPPQTGCCAAKA